MTEELKAEIAKLEELQERLVRVRQVPPALLQLRTGQGAAEQFGAVKEIGEAVMSDPVQSALHHARESLQKDPSGLAGADPRRTNRKRRRAATPEGIVQEHTAVLPRRPEAAVTLDELGAWAWAWNEAHPEARLRIRGRVVRLVLTDVLTVYLGLGVGRDGREVVVETVRAFGARERVLGHGQSGFAVFQQLSQQLGRGLGDGAGLGTVAGHVLAYMDLFVGRCEVCGRVVSAEGHVPCVVRWWDGAGWRAEHAGCGRA